MRGKYFIGALCVLLCFISFTLRPVRARAFDGIDAIVEYYDDFKHNYNLVQQALVHDIESGNLDATSSIGRQILSTFALQSLGFITFGNHYQPFLFEDDWSDAVIPETITFSGSGSGGLFYDVSGSLHFGILSIPSAKGGIWFHSDIFDVVLDASHYTLDFIVESHQPSVISQNGNTYIGFTSLGSVSGNYLLAYVDGSYSFIYGTREVSGRSYMMASGSSIPTVSGDINADGYIRNEVGSYNTPIIGNGVDVALPESTVEFSTPWDYYNNVILPYIINNYNDIDNINNYLIFPSGYYPPQPPTYPQGGIWIGDQYNIDIDIISPTNDSGEPLTDEQGETVTETVIVSDTRETDAVYRFEVPTLPSLNVENASLPLETSMPSEITNPLLGMFALIGQIFDMSGITPVIPILFTMGIIFYTIYRLS